LKVAREKQSRGQLSTQHAGAALAQQADIESRPMTLDDYAMEIARQEKAKLDRVFELGVTGVPLRSELPCKLL
jgi:hypothetical protein